MAAGLIKHAPATPLATRLARITGADLATPKFLAIYPSVTATASVLAHTPGTWTELVASTPADADIIDIRIGTTVGANGVNSATLVDVAVGPAGLEAPIISGINIGYSISGQSVFRVPIRIPAGSRIAVRAQSAVSLQAVLVGGVLLSQPNLPAPSTTVDALGANTASSRGTVLSTAAVNTEGAWTQLVAATSQPYCGLLVEPAGGGGTVWASGSCLLDIGVGPSGQETAIITDLSYSYSTSEQITPRQQVPLYAVNIPAGTRIAARFQRDSTNNTMDVLLHGIPRR